MSISDRLGEMHARAERPPWSPLSGRRPAMSEPWDEFWTAEVDRIANEVILDSMN